MTIEYSGHKYETTLESVYFDFSVRASSLEEACSIVIDMAEMECYTFGKVEHRDMVVTKRVITVDAGGITVKVVLREKTEAEKVKEELEALKADISAIVQTSSKSDAAKFTGLLEKAGNKSTEVIK